MARTHVDPTENKTCYHDYVTKEWCAGTRSDGSDSLNFESVQWYQDTFLIGHFRIFFSLNILS